MELYCTTCKLNKPEGEFFPSIKTRCKTCLKIYYEKNKSKIAEKAKLKRVENPEEYKKKKREEYNSLSIEKKKERNKKSHESFKLYGDKEKKKLTSKEYEEKNKDKRRIQRAITRKNRYWTDLNYRLEILLRTRLYKAVKRHKVKSAKLLVGCTSEELKNYIASKFKPEMNWINFGEIWEIDHIIPIASFDMSIQEDQEKCFHYTNLQPLFKTTEIAKSFGYNEIGNMNKSKNTNLKNLNMETFNLDYFIKKFKAIPNRKWNVGKQLALDGTRCALGHCKLSEIDKFADLFNNETLTIIKKTSNNDYEVGDILYPDMSYNNINKVAAINNGETKEYQQETPKKRIVAALENLKKYE